MGALDPHEAAGSTAKFVRYEHVYERVGWNVVKSVPGQRADPGQLGSRRCEQHRSKPPLVGRQHARRVRVQTGKHTLPPAGPQLRPDGFVVESGRDQLSTCRQA
ncbi:MAG: hypothetical protein ACRDT2_11930 [Natronosporangium sp.]